MKQEKLLKELEKALFENRQRDFIDLLINYGNVDKYYADFENEQLDKIIDFLRKGIEIDNTNPTLYNIICALYPKWDVVDHILGLENDIPDKPEAWIAWWELARAYRITKQYDKLYKAVKKAHEYDIHDEKYIPLAEYYNFILNPEPIEKISIRRHYSLRNIKLNDLTDKKEIYFLGENGVGKTILLQAIVKTLKKTDEIMRRGYDYKISTDKTERSEAWCYLNTYAYGVGRLRTHDYETDKTGHGTLFDQQKVNLTNPISWLKDIERLDLKKTSPLKFNTVLNLLNEILSIDIKENSSNDIQIFLDDKTGDILFKEQGTILEFNQLADGYRSLLILLVDLLKRLIENQPDVKKLKDYKGVVLIDEIDMLLHPKLEYSIVKKLREKLPNIQWFFTTHSPMLILGASEDAVFYRLYKEEGETKISEPWTSEDIKHLMSNSLITSPLFDMPTARMKMLKDKTKMDTSDDYWIGKIYDKIKQQVNHRKNSGKTYLSKEQIDEYVEWAIREIDKEVEK